MLYERTEGDQTTRYYYDEEAKLMAEAEVKSGKAELTYVYIYDLYGKLWARQDKKTGKLEYYQFNGHGDVVGLVDDAGQVLNEYTYDIWGGPRTTEETVPNVLRYAGEYWDDTVGLQYLRARWYDPGMARFIGEDTYEGELNDPLSLNLYSYVSNNPLKYVDPSGNRKTSTYYEIEKMLNAAMKGDNSFKSSLNKVFTKVYGDKGVKFANLYAQLTQTSGAFINSQTNAGLAKTQLLNAYENGQDRYDVQVAWTTIAGGVLSGSIYASLSDSVSNLGKKALKSSITNIWVKNKHLSGGTGSWARFNVATEAEAKNLITSAIKKGKIKSVTNNNGSIGSAGQKSYEIIIDAGRTIGTRNEKMIKIVVDELGNLWSVYPK
ncbi:RHS repeat-associated protein [Paenibacillus sp. PvP094]|uniref:RHS repeat-associated core domain-containing protein n=1 Tax=Paenibacillus sp. PvP094 TaxID=3156394 RepID=UPI0033945C3F